MPKTVSLTEVQIHRMTIDPGSKSVTIDFHLRDADGRSWENGKAVFWVNIPELEPGMGTAEERNWFQLPPQYVTNIADLLNSAQTALAVLVTD